jgi:hypothetical protein
MLLNAYAFATMGRIAGIAAVVSFAGATLLLLLSALGIWHSRRVSPAQGAFDAGHERIPQTA